MNKNGSLIANGFWSLTTQIVRVGSLAAIMIALSRHFGPQRFGTLAVGLAFVRIFGVLATFGLDKILVRHLVDHHERFSAIVRESFRLKLAIAMLSYVAMIVVILAIGDGDRLLLYIGMFAGAGLFFMPCDVYEYAFQSQNRFGLAFLGRGVPILVSTAIKGIAIVLNAPLLVFAALETVEAALIATALALLYRGTSAAEDTPESRSPIRWARLAAEGLPMLLSALAVMIYMRSDVILLGKLAGHQAAGIYAAASQISEACTLIPFALMPALFPLLVRWRALGLEFYQRQFERLFLIAITTGVLFSIVITVSAHAIVDLLFGANYHSAGNVLMVHAWTIVFVFIGITQSGYEVTERLTWFGSAKTFLGAVLNIILNVIFIPRYGVVGSAVATLIAQIFSCVLLNGLHPRTRPILRLQINSLLVWPAVRDLFGKPARGASDWRELPNQVTLADGR
jgi:PST family polysaccharide transporter